MCAASWDIYFMTTRLIFCLEEGTLCNKSRIAPHSILLRKFRKKADGSGFSLVLQARFSHLFRQIICDTIQKPLRTLPVLSF